SNELMWRESIAEVVRIPLSPSGLVNMEILAQECAKYAGRTVKIGSFSAGSNVTGALTDTDAVGAVLRTHGFYSFWDYA
ncbi:hypothetical protein T484DRAFT_1593708, partial [Baffinella frigidus]